MLLLNSPPDFSLNPQRIDIWAFFLNHLPVNIHKFLSDEEKYTANRFIFPRHQRRYATSHAVLRVLLSHYLKQSPTSIQFKTKKHGKPFIEDPSALEFNLTHSKDLAILAIGQKFQLGIDTEFFSPRSYEGIAHALYSKQELNIFLKLPPWLKQLCFFNIWAQKEAFIKACGLGLSYPTKEFTVPVSAPSSELIFDALHNQEWKIFSFMPQLACCGALCYHPSIDKIYYSSINTLDILTSSY